VSYIYDGSFSGTVIPGAGVTGAALAQKGIQVYTEENLPWGWSNMDYQQITEKLVDWLKLKAQEAGATGYVVGLSGGVDSAVTAALIKRAFPDNALGVIIPIESADQDREDALLVAESVGLEVIQTELSGVFTTLLDTLEPGIHLPKDNLAAANIKPRLRMLALYYFAARRGALVAGTGNKSELVSGFFTKYGDGAVDVEPLGELVKTEIWELAAHLGIPQWIIDRVPTAGLWPDQTDEGELGFSYQELDEYIRTGKTSSQAQAKIEVLAQKIQHKLEPPPVCPL
jgi:NAD+ synthase